MINDKNKNTWCVNSHHAIAGSNDGKTKICCMVRDYDMDVTLGVEPITEHFNRPSFQEIRNDLDNGIRNNSCRLCWQEEDAGRKSKRQRDNEKYFHALKWKHMEPYEGLAKVELNLGNTCNISCRTCQAEISSGWYKETYELWHKDQKTYKQFASDLKQFNLRYEEDSPFWDDIEQHLSTIKQFDFYGGEPFMSKKMWSLLKIAVEKGYAKDIELHYNTNGTIWPKEIELWKHFKSINLSFSIDGIGEQFEYMRYPAKWDVVKENIENAIALNNVNGNMSISWCVTISNLNIFDLPETLNYWQENYSHLGLYLNLVHGPEFYNISKMPQRYKQDAVDIINTQVPRTNQKAWGYLDGINNFILQGTPDEKVWKTFLSRTALHDDYRKQNFKRTWPNLSKLVEKHELL